VRVDAQHLENRCQCRLAMRRGMAGELAADDEGQNWVGSVLLSYETIEISGTDSFVKLSVSEKVLAASQSGLTAFGLV